MPERRIVFSVKKRDEFIRNAFFYFNTKIITNSGNRIQNNC